MMKQIGKYTVLGKLAEGGMARVLRGLAPDGSAVVLKMPLKRDAETLARIEDEARLGMRLSHPAIVRTRALEHHEGVPVVVLDYISGVTLEALVSQTGPLDVVTVAYIGAVVGDALATLHSATGDDGQPLHIVHRDITPRNILVSDAGIPVLIDLGIARSDIDSHKTATGVLIGTLPYLSPELLEEEGQPSPASDMWSLGCVMFECATGGRLFKGPQPKVLGRLVKEQPVKPKHLEVVPPSLRPVVARMLRRDPQKRIHDGRQVARAVDELNEPRAAREMLQGRCRAMQGDAPTEKATVPAAPKHTAVESPTLPGNPFGPAPVSIPGVGHLGVPASNPRLDVPPQSEPAPAPASTPAFAPLRSAPEEGANLQAAFDDALASVDAGVSGKALSASPQWTTGEVKKRLRSDRPAPRAADARAFRPPAVNDVSLELDVSPTPPTRDVLGARVAPHLSEKRSRRFSFSTLVTWVLALGIVAGVGYVAYRYNQGRSPTLKTEVEALDRERARLEAEARALGEAFVRQERPSKAPECWQSDHGWFFVYEESNGSQSVKQRILDVPRRYRPGARCVKSD